jgi:signal transduction histidine kinase
VEAVSCEHRASGRNCPISKTPCLGECIFASILDQINLGIIGLDVARREVFYQNKQAIDIFRETMKPRDYAAISNLLLSDLIRMPFASLRMNDSRTIQYGRKFINYSLYVVNESYLWIYVSDATEKMRLDSIAEAVNMMNNLGYIFSGIRHELGNPINSIKTSVTVCRKNLQSYSKETVAEFLDRALSDLNRVETLLKDLKNFSMFENPECADVVIESFLNNLLSIVEKDFDVRNIRIKTFVRPSAEHGYFDARAMQQVMLNILTNASDALDGVVTPAITISVLRVGDRLILKVMDNGKGISDEQKKHLFQPFSTTKTHGTGLGLVIVKKMLLKMDGTIEIESQEKVGTTVTINIPAEKMPYAL